VGFAQLGLAQLGLAQLGLVEMCLDAGVLTLCNPMLGFRLGVKWVAVARVTEPESFSPKPAKSK